MAQPLSIAMLGSPVNEGSSGPVRGQLNAILKSNTVSRYCVPNEFICSEIGRFLGLPIPPCGICYIKPKTKDDPAHWFASLNFNLTGVDLPPIDVNQCCSLCSFEAVGVVLFDILIGNCDRHENNLSLDLSRPIPQLSVFDHDRALFGGGIDSGQSRLERDIEDFIVGYHCLIGAIENDDHFAAWCERIEGLPNYLIDQVCTATVPLELISASEANTAKRFLKQRKSKLKDLIYSNKGDFAGIKSWHLI